MCNSRGSEGGGVTSAIFDNEKILFDFKFISETKRFVTACTGNNYFNINLIVDRLADNSQANKIQAGSANNK